MSTHIKGWSQGDVNGTLRHLDCDLVVDGLYLRIGRALFWRSEDGTWSVAAGGLHRHTHTLEEMIAAQQAITTAGALLCDQWSGWIVGGATAGDGVGDVGVVEPSTAVCPFKVGDEVELLDADGTVASPCKVSGVSHPTSGQWSLYLVDMDGMCHVASADSCRRLERPSVTTENGTFRKGDPVMVKRYGRTLKGTVCEVDPTDPVRPARVRLHDIGQRWILAEHLAHA